VINDKVIGGYVNSLNHEIEKLEKDIARANFTDLYPLGKLQGQVVGLEAAKQLLMNVLEQEDK